MDVPLVRGGRTTVALASAIGLLVALAPAGCRRGSAAHTTLHLYCAAGIREPVAEVIRKFEDAHGVIVEADYAGSNVLLSRIKLSREGDLYMPGDVFYVRQADEDDLIASYADVSYWVPVIMVEKGNPRGITDVTDLAQPGLRVGLGEPEACAIGRTTDGLLAKNGLDAAALGDNLVYRAVTVNDLAVQVKVGELDATIVWDAIAEQYPDDGEAVAIPPDRNIISTVPVAVLRSSENPDSAEAFQAFVTSKSGRAIFASHGYTTELPE